MSCFKKICNHALDLGTAADIICDTLGSQRTIDLCVCENVGLLRLLWGKKL